MCFYGKCLLTIPLAALSLPAEQAAWVPWKMMHTSFLGLSPGYWSTRGCWRAAACEPTSCIWLGWTWQVSPYFLVDNAIILRVKQKSPNFSPVHRIHPLYSFYPLFIIFLESSGPCVLNLCNLKYSPCARVQTSVHRGGSRPGNFLPISLRASTLVLNFLRAADWKHSWLTLNGRQPTHPSISVWSKYSGSYSFKKAS